MIKFNNEIIENAIMDALDKMERGIEINEVDRNELINVILKYGDRDFGIDTANRKYTEEELQYSVYIHINGSNSKCYIGRTRMKPKDRWGSNGLGYRRQYFHENIKKYKWKNFSHIVLCYGLTKEEGDRFEINLISILKSNNKDFGYNIANGGNCVGMFSQETLNKMSNNRKGIKFSEEHKKKIGEAHKGEKHHKAKKVYCNGVIFQTAKECSEYYNVNYGAMKFWLQGRRKTPSEFIEKGLRYATEEDIEKYPICIEEEQTQQYQQDQ